MVAGIFDDVIDWFRHVSISTAQRKAEQDMWNQDVLFHEESRSKNLPLISEFKNGEKLFLFSRSCKSNGISYDHWFVTDGSQIIEFGHPHGDIYQSIVTVRSGTFTKQDVLQGEYKMDGEIATRMSHVMGMTNYSLCFRNSENVSVYITRGFWMSSQMDSSGKLKRIFDDDLRNHSSANLQRNINCLPSYLLCIENEKKAWQDSTCLFDERSRSDNLPLIDNFTEDKTLIVASRPFKSHGIQYEHWFITNGSYIIEFSHPNGNINEAILRIRSGTLTGQDVKHETCKMNDAIAWRMKCVVGMKNFSLCFRNSEHVSKFITHRLWMSSQMDSNGNLMRIFEAGLVNQDLKTKVNSFPSNLQPSIFKGKDRSERHKIYSFINDSFTATQSQWYLDSTENSLNVLLVGATGCGKSHLTNVLFNERIVESSRSLNSVTHEINFIIGSVGSSEKKVVVCDTVGFCDEIDMNSMLLTKLQGRISSNCEFIHLVLIVYQATRRMLKDGSEFKAITSVLNWLEYPKYSKRFVFVATHLDQVDSGTENKLTEEIRSLFNLKKETRVLYVGFPDQSRPGAQKIVEKSWKSMKETFQNMDGCDIRTSKEENTVAPDVEKREENSGISFKNLWSRLSESCVIL